MPKLLHGVCDLSDEKREKIPSALAMAHSGQMDCYVVLGVLQACIREGFYVNRYMYMLTASKSITIFLWARSSSIHHQSIPINAAQNEHKTCHKQHHKRCNTLAEGQLLDIVPHLRLKHTATSSWTRSTEAQAYRQLKLDALHDCMYTGARSHLYDQTNAW